jgi:branched-chain amino acid transport system substrate-binding protein
VISEQVREQGVTDAEIRIGNLMPYSGNLEVFGAIGKAEAAYFEITTSAAGSTAREVRFISYDDKSNPMAALDLTRTLIEKDNVLLTFGSFGTPGNFAVRRYLNERQIPQRLRARRRCGIRS